MPENRYEKQKDFWENAGNIGYNKAIYSDSKVANHIRLKHWDALIKFAQELGLNNKSKILELGCGDGYFADKIISDLFGQIDSFDVSKAAIERAKSNLTATNINFYNEDITVYDYKENDYWDGAFLVGFLHHVKPFVPEIISKLSKVAPSVVVLEPNGDNLIRKFLELTPSYQKAGEDSFKLQELTQIFEKNGYKLEYIKKLTFAPPFLPESLLPIFKILENIIEPNPCLNNLCSTYILGFRKETTLL